MEGTSTSCLSRSVEKEISLAVFQRTGCSTGLELGRKGSWEGPWPVENSSPVICSAGGTGLRNWVCSFALHDQHLLLGSLSLHQASTPEQEEQAGLSHSSLPPICTVLLPHKTTTAQSLHPSPRTRLPVLLKTSSMGCFGGLP